MNQDFVDLLRAFSAHEVRYLVVGAYALGVHGRPRATGDLDVWVDATPANAARIMAALAAFGAPLAGVVAGDFSHPGIVFQMGLPPRRIDVLTALTALGFDIPGQIQNAASLTDYAVAARYPGPSEPVDAEDVEAAVELARPL